MKKTKNQDLEIINHINRVNEIGIKKLTFTY